MFGYVKAWKPELRICEFEAYKAIYCGLCKDMGKRFGVWARFTLSYDFTFLAMLGMAMEPDDPSISLSRCPFNPLKRINTCHDNESLSFAGDVAMLMLWHKLEDNRTDGGFAERIVSALAMLFVRGAYRKVSEKHGELADIMRDAMAQQAKLEQEGCADLDRICHPSAHMLGSVMQKLTRDSTEGQSRVLYRLGYLMGRYVYISDALDDMEQDAKEHGYNPLLLRNHAESPNEAIRAEAQGSLFMTIAEAGAAYELLEIKRFAPILDNILFMGLRKNTEAILIPRKDRPREKKF